MKSSIAFWVNIGITCITISVMILSCSGCTDSQLEQVKTVIDTAKPVIDTAAPSMANQPWYVLVLLAADIASSIVAGLIAYKKKTTVQ